MAYTINWDQVSALARNKHVPKVKDNFFLSNALFYRLKGKQKSMAGGPLVVVPLGFAPEGGGGSWYSGTDRFDTTIRNPIKAANYFPHNAQVTIAIDGDEELAVTGPEAVLNLVETKMRIAENTMVDLVGTNLFNAGTNPKAIGGLQLALPDNITGASQTYGGISCGGSAPSSDTNGWWQPNSDNTSYTTGSAGTLFYATTGATPMAKMLARIGARAGKQPSVIVSNWGSWTEYHNSLAKNERYDRPQQQTDMAKAGFTNLMYRNMPWVVDERAPHDSSNIEKIYLIDEKALSIYVHPQRDFYLRKWGEPIDQDARVAYLFHRMEICFDERRSSGVISNVDASLTLSL